MDQIAATAFGGSLIGALAGFLFGMRHAFRRIHRDPCLHDMAKDGLTSPWVFRGVSFGKPHRMHWDRKGVKWDEAKAPLPTHRCRTQTCELTTTLLHTDRCACGGERYGAGPWEGRNTRWTSSLPASSSESELYL